jgi:hypothetical protein
VLAARVVEPDVMPIVDRETVSGGEAQPLEEPETLGVPTSDGHQLPASAVPLRIGSSGFMCCMASLVSCADTGRDRGARRPARFLNEAQRGRFR